MQKNSRERIAYLAQESALFLLFSYLILLGGTFNGLVLPVLNKINLLIIALIGFSWIIFRFLTKGGGELSILDLGAAIMILSGGISTYFSVDPVRSLIGLNILISAVLIYYLFEDLIRRGLSPHLISKVLLLTSGFILFFGIRELVIWYGGWLEIAGPGEYIPPATYRVRAFLGHPNFLAAYLNLLIPLALAAFFLAKQILSKAFLSAWLLLAFVLVFFTSSRGGWLGTFVALTVFALGYLASNLERIKVFVSSMLKKRWLMGLGVFIGLGIVGGLVILLKWQSSHPTHPTDWNNIFGSRDYIWIVARDMFSRNILAGNGLFTYGTEYLKVESIPPNMLLAHAHNYYLNIAGEQGIVGLIGLVVYCSALIATFWKSWRSHQYLNKVELSGLAAALAGMGAHSIFETPQTLPVLLILPGILIAQIHSGINAERTKDFRSFKNILLAGLLVFIVACLYLNNQQIKLYERALAYAGEGDLAQSANSFEELNKNAPGHALYWFQAGQAYGLKALDESGLLVDISSLEKGLYAYQTGLAIEDRYSVNWINLGLLYLAKGDNTEALYAFQQGVELSPKQPVFWLLIARQYETLNRMTESRNAFQQALALSPELISQPLIQESSPGLEIYQDWISSGRPTDTVWDPELERAWEHFQAGEYQLALDALGTIDVFNNPEAHLMLGRIYVETGDLIKAEKALKTARWMGSTNNALRLKIFIALGDLALKRSDLFAAKAAYENAADLLQRTTSYGIGEMGETQYSWYLYYKNSFPQDLLPGGILPIYTQEAFRAVEFLQNWYCEQGDDDMVNKYNLIVVKHGPVLEGNSKNTDLGCSK